MNETDLSKNMTTPLKRESPMLFLFILVVGVLGGFLLSSHFSADDSSESLGQRFDPSNTDNPFSEVLEVSESDAVYGNKNADVIIFEYSDVGCPYCSKFHITGKEIVDDSNGKIAWVYRHLPIVRDFSEVAAKQLECVKNKLGEETFWKVLDKIFSNSSVSGEIVSRLTGEAGLSSIDIDRCLDEDSVESRQVDMHIKQGRVFGFRGTPAGFVSNRKTGKYEVLGGAIPIEQLRYLIESLND